MALWKTQYIKDPAGGPYADPDTFESLVLWEAQNLAIPAGDHLNVECDSFRDAGGACDFGGWSYGDTDSRVYIIPSPGTEFSGDYPVTSASFESFIQGNATNNTGFRIRDGSKITVRGIGINTGQARCWWQTGTNGTQSVIDGCWVECVDVYAIDLLGSNSSGTYRHALNNIVTGLCSGIRNEDLSNFGVVIANNTIILDGNDRNGVNATGQNGYIANNTVFRTVTATTGLDYIGPFGSGTTGANNVSSDANALGDNPIINATAAQFVDLTSYRPEPTNVLANAGVNLDTIFTDDIVGYTRPASPTAWTIGAYEIQGGVVGVQEMYTNVSGTFKEAVPSVKVGAEWKPANAYVNIGGVWKTVYEQ